MKKFLVALLLVAAPAAAQYPSKSVRIIVPAAPGGGTDITARSFVKDFVPVTLVAHEPVVLVTHPSNPANSLGEFTRWAKDQEAKGKLSYATDPGSAGFLGAELYKQLAGVKAEYIAYKGSGPAAADVVGGHVPYMWSVISIVTPYAKAGRMKALSIAAEKRSPSLPDVPTTAEGGMPNFQVSGWYGLLAPAGTPKGFGDGARSPGRRREMRDRAPSPNSAGARAWSSPARSIFSPSRRSS